MLDYKRDNKVTTYQRVMIKLFHVVLGYTYKQRSIHSSGPIGLKHLKKLFTPVLQTFNCKT